MRIDPRIVELLLHHEELQAQGRSIRPEELCRDCPELLGEVRRCIRDLRLVAPPVPAAAGAEEPGRRSEGQPPSDEELQDICRERPEGSGRGAPPGRAVAGRRPAAGSAGDGALPGGEVHAPSTGTSTPTDTGVRIRCPHCHSPLQLGDERSDGVLCPGCGGSFRLREARHTDTTSPMKTLGRFQLLERVGLGAFGAVWRARDTALDRIVALKIPHTGLLTEKEELERFHREARAAAQLRHPGIVAVHEVTVLNGLPVIVAEFVQGAPLRDLLEVRRPTFRQAAALAAEMAEALDYAHSLGVVHRDVKPGNILLVRDPPRAGEGDAAGSGPAGELTELGRPLLVDFGLALRDAAEITMTVDGHIVGTPAYMSPEQAAGESHRADRRSDVYSLGVILYEMLTGELPFRGSRPLLLQQVRHDEPRSPRKLNDRIPRDLETVCLKAMRKSPQHRYATARDMADDLRRFLRGEPVTARPVGLLEQVWRWCRRNPAATLASAAALLVLAIGLVGMTALYLNAEHQRDRARLAHEAAKEADAQRREARKQAVRFQQVTEALKGMFEVSDPLGVQDFLYGAPDAGTKITALDMLKFCNERLKKSQGYRPRVRADLLDTLGSVYRSLARYDDAEKMLQEAYELRLNNQAPPGEIAASEYSLGALYHSKGDYLRAVQLYHKSLKARRQEDPADPVAIGNCEFNLAWALAELEQLAESEKLFKNCLERRLKFFGPDHRQTAVARMGLVTIYLDTERTWQANAQGEELVRTFGKISWNRSLPDTLALLKEGMIRSLVYGDHAGAEKKLRAALELARNNKELGPRHPYVTIPMGLLATTLEQRGREHDAEAQALYEEVLGIVEEQERVGLGHPKALIVVRKLTRVQKRRGQADKAEALYEKVLKIYRGRFREASRFFVADVLYDYADLLGPAQRDRYAKLLEEAVSIYQATDGPAHNRQPRKRHGECLNALGELRLQERNYAESERLFREAMEVLGQQPYAQPSLEARVRSNAAYVHLSQDKASDARRWKDVAIELTQCLLLVERDRKLTNEEKGRLREEYGERAVGLLRRALEKSPQQAAEWANEPLLRPLRDRADFQQLLDQVRKK